MPNNFLNTLTYLVALSLGLAFVVTAIIFGFTLFAIIFTYIFIPLFIIALLRWLWLKYQISKKGQITYYDEQ